MLAKIRQFFDKSTLTTTNFYFSNFSSILTYDYQTWGQHRILNANIKRITKLTKLQNKALRIINFADFHAPSSPLYKTPQILKLKDLITLNNFLYVHNCLSGNIPSSFLRSTFSYIHPRHDYPTKISKKMYHFTNLNNTEVQHQFNKWSISKKLELSSSYSLQIFKSWTNKKQIYKQMITSHFINSYQ